MKVKPKEIMVVLPAAHLFQSEDEMASFASAINTIIHGKVKIKYEVLGQLGGQYVGLFYIQRNNESQEIHDEFVRLIEQEEIRDHFSGEELPEDDEMQVSDAGATIFHRICPDCDALSMLHQKGLQHCECGEDWVNGRCESRRE
jgi:hypothetical protein